MLLNNITPFLDSLFDQLDQVGLSLSGKEIDHICYRTSSEENYKSTKIIAESLGTLLIESDVNGRLIATYRLHQPLSYKDWLIPLLEIPAPKPGKITREGLEHIEVIIDESFQSFIKRYPHLSFQLKAMQKEINPDIELELNGCSIKFHHQSLENVIEYERKILPKK